MPVTFPSAAFAAFPSSVLFAVSVNPEDTADSAKLAASRWGWDWFDWHWLLGSRENLATIADDYGVYVKQTPTDTGHTAVVYLIDANGDVRDAYLAPLPVGRMIADIKHLGGGSPLPQGLTIPRATASPTTT